MTIFTSMNVNVNYTCKTLSAKIPIANYVVKSGL